MPDHATPVAAMSGPAHDTSLIGVVAVVWLAIAILATLIGIRRAAQGRRAIDEARAIADLLAASPVVPMLVYADGRIDLDPRVVDRLGLTDAPSRLSGLEEQGVLAAADMAMLERAVDDARTLAAPIHLRMPVAGTTRTIVFRGGAHGIAGGRGQAVLLWLVDISVQRQEQARLQDQVVRLDRAIDGLSALIEAAPFPMWHRAPDLSLALVNGAYVRAIEAASAEDAIARGIELIDDGSGTSAQAQAAAARDRDETLTRTVPAIINGERRLMRVVDVPVGAAGVAGYAIDVQEVEEVRSELVQFEHAQHDMLDRLSAGVAQFASDHTLTFHNSYFAALFAMAPEWLRDRPTFDLVLERMRESQRAPENRDFPSWRAERRGWFANTQATEESWLLPAGTHLRVVAQPLPDRGLLLIFEDRTEHLRLASARDTLLRVRAATFDNLFESVGVFAADGRLQLWNNRFGELWGLAQAELAEHPRVDALMQAIAPRLLDPNRAALIRDTVRVATHERQHRSGRISLIDGRHFEFAAVPLPDGNALFALLDVTASRENEAALRDRNEALEETNRLKNAFVSSMSYELRVPLTSITGFAEMLAGGYAGELNETARDYVNAIVSAVGRLSTLMGDVLDLTQSEVGSLPMEMETLALSDVVRSALDRARESAWGAGLALAADVAPDGGTILGDRRRLAQALDHLLRNAIAYTPPGGRVLARVRQLGTTGEIMLSDNGRGMTGEQIRHAFEGIGRTSMLDPSASDGAPKRGFGLSLARKLIEAHGGALELVSEVGQGSTLTIRLPLAVEAEAA